MSINEQLKYLEKLLKVAFNQNIYKHIKTENSTPEAVKFQKLQLISNSYRSLFTDV